MTSSSLTPAFTSRSASRHHVRGGAAGEVAAQLRDDAERAAVVAAFGNLQIRVVARRQAQAFRRHQIDEGIVQRRHRLVHGGDHLLVLVRAGDGQHARVRRADARLLDAEAAGDDDAAVLGHRLADGVEALLLGRVEEAAGVDHHHVGAGVVGRQLVALGAQLGDDALGVDQRLRAAERDDADARRGLGLGAADFGRGLGGRPAGSFGGGLRHGAACSGGRRGAQCRAIDRHPGLSMRA